MARKKRFNENTNDTEDFNLDDDMDYSFLDDEEEDSFLDDDDTTSILNVGVVGFTEKDFDEVEAKVSLENIFDDIEADYITNGRHSTIRVISGGTIFGISKIAYDVSSDRGYATMAIVPEQARSYHLYDVDDIVWVGEKFGEESETFVDMLDVLVKIGGGDQSNNEAKMADERDIPVMEYDL